MFASASIWSISLPAWVQIYLADVDALDAEGASHAVPILACAEIGAY
jgi:hypothetical protein